MDIFISWSGSRSRQLAGALEEFLQKVFETANTFLSTEDIGPGERWSPKIAQALNDINYGILCITPENKTAPWILFEAGALAKSLEDAKVVPLLFEVEATDLDGPLAQFQAIKVDREGVLRVVKALHTLSGSTRAETVVNDLFETLWESFEEKVNSIPDPKGGATEKHRSSDDLLEELVLRVRSIERKIDNNSNTESLFNSFSESLTPQQLNTINTVFGARRAEGIEGLFSADLGTQGILDPNNPLGLDTGPLEIKDT